MVRQGGGIPSDPFAGGSAGPGGALKYKFMTMLPGSSSVSLVSVRGVNCVMVNSSGNRVRYLRCK